MVGVGLGLQRSTMQGTGDGDVRQTHHMQPEEDTLLALPVQAS